jgi:putative selenium metabolism hydrolase
MQRLDYDQAWIDMAGNVVGVVRGGPGPVTMFNGHMDIVDAGNPDSWQHPPFGAEIHEEHLWGRGSADMKGALAGMLFAAGLFKSWNRKPKGDIIVCTVGLEEVGGWGTHLLLKDGHLSAERAVVGEPTNNRILLGHRGRIILKAHIKGQSMHGSIVNNRANPLFSLARFIDSLSEVTASLAGRFSYLTIVPTATTSSPVSSNVTASVVTQSLDVRVGPDVDAEMICQELNQLLQECLGRDCSGRVDIAKQKLRTFTGIDLEVNDLVPGYELSTDHPWPTEAAAILRTVLAQDPLGELAGYTCDASRLYQEGIPTILFGPGDIGLAHAVGERIPIQQLLESVVGYMALVW